MPDTPTLPPNSSPDAPAEAGRPTPLAVDLALGLGPALPLVPVGGALTPSVFDAAGRETEALLGAAAAYDLGWLRRVAVRGSDRFRWLSGMVTNTVNDLAADGLAWNLLLNAQGRILGDLHVWREGEDLSLVLALDQQTKILTHLDRFIIMDDVELAPVEDQSALGLAGPRAAAILEGLGLPAPAEPMTHGAAIWNGQQLRVARAWSTLVPRFELWAPVAAIPALWRALGDAVAGAAAAGAEALESLRVAEGLPRYGTDILERDLPQETSQLRALHFNKGCYLGQEIVERIRSRGQVHRHLRSLELDGPLPEAGAELTYAKADGAHAPAGSVTSAAQLELPRGPRRFALAMIRAEAELRPQPLAYTTPAGAGAARILAAPPSIELN